jgi:hypothetical protein
MSIASISSVIASSPLGKTARDGGSRPAGVTTGKAGGKDRTFGQSLVEQDTGDKAAANPAAPESTGPLRSGAAKPAAASRVEPSLLRRGLQSVMADESRVKAQLTRALRGRVDNLADLLRIQVSVYKYSQHLDLMSKAVDKANQAVKQTLQTRV